MTRDITEAPCILVDTNVWLDMYIPNRKGADDAIRLIDIAQEQSASLAFASHTCLDVFQKVSFEQAQPRGLRQRHARHCHRHPS